ncbi:hypothetical protein [Tautonia plasticadhaerens]|uniref:Uncharacterized protein n=1 Tax=Tautonia plasticadhaerens TaxID=2527974 RepID=A0A518H7X7_9BACT|nr:hypothetical protein [Tautonia plasticadhaerens]QDV36943.1 hypothetical protein ElP_48730 [Tautonia plasticadhaerens]
MVARTSLCWLAALLCAITASAVYAAHQSLSPELEQFRHVCAGEAHALTRQADKLDQLADRLAAEFGEPHALVLEIRREAKQHRTDAASLQKVADGDWEELYRREAARSMSLVQSFPDRREYYFAEEMKLRRPANTIARP